MIVPDANLLLYVIDASSPDHQSALAWWKALLKHDEPIGLCHPVVFAFIRLSTHRRVFTNPLSVEEAFAYTDNWLSFPQVSWMDPIPAHYITAKSLLIQAGTGANLVTDAQIAALAIHHDATIHSADSDFSRFPSVRWMNPIARPQTSRRSGSPGA